jgi:hypothetical protein
MLNLIHWPIGIGVQRLADTFILLGMPFDTMAIIVEFSDSAREKETLGKCLLSQFTVLLDKGLVA